MTIPIAGTPGSNVTNQAAAAVALPGTAPAVGNLAVAVISHRDVAVGPAALTGGSGFGTWSHVSGAGGSSPLVQGNSRLAVFTAPVVSVPVTAPSMADTGDHQQARVFYISHPDGTPEIHAVQATLNATSNQSGSAVGPTTTVADCLICLFASADLPDSNSTLEYSAVVNASLASVSIMAQNSVSTGGGSAKLLAKGNLAAAGPSGTWTYTKTNNSVKTNLVVAFAPPVVEPPPEFPTVSVADDFNRANAQPPSANWLGSFAAGWRVVSNQLVNASGGWDGIYWNADSAADLECFATIAQVGATGTQMQLHVRRDPAADTGYFVSLVAGAGNDTLILWRRIAATDVQLGLDDATRNFSAGDGIGLQIIGSKIYVWHKPAAGSWTLVMTRTNTEITAAGKVGIFSNATGWILDDFGGPTIVTGPVTHFGATSLVTNFNRTTAGSRKTFSTLDRPFTFAAAVAGKVITTHFGSVALPVAFGASTAGRRKTFGQAALPVAFSKDVRGQRKTFGQLLSPLIFNKAVTGQRKTFGQVAMPLSAVITTAGFKPGVTQYGIVSLPVIFSKDVRGQRKAFGQLAFPLVFAKDVQGRRKTFGQLALPIIFTKEAAGRKQAFGQLAMQTLFGKETAGRRRTFSQLAMPVVFSKAVAGRKQTFGRVAIPINATFVVSGYGWLGAGTHYGQLALPISFGKQVSARRKTFGQVTAPFLFGIASQGSRRTFSRVAFPIGFAAAVKSGRVGAHGIVKLEFVLTIDTTGRVKTAGVILNLAENVYLGTEPVEVVYVGTEKVWPEL